MPRNASGDYSLPAGNPVVTGTTIDSSWANNTMDDIATAITDSLSRSGDGGMLVAFENADGSVGAPGISWVSEPTTGFYRAATNDMRVSVAGGDRARFRLDSTNPFQIWSGGAWVNALDFSFDSKVKTANQTVNNVSTPAIDTHLTGFVLEAGARYSVEVLLRVTNGDNIANFNSNFTFTNAPVSGAKFYKSYQGIPDTGAAGTRDTITANSYNDADSTGPNLIHIKGFFQANATTGGTFSFYWSQNIARAVDTVVLAGSYMEVRKLG